MRQQYSVLRDGAFRLVMPLLSILLCSPLLAQLDMSAQLVGTVADPSGAVVPAAQLVARNQLTGVETRTTSDERGGFVFPSLPSGTYTVTCEVTGFQTFVAPGIVLQAGKIVTLPTVLQPRDGFSQVPLGRSLPHPPPKQETGSSQKGPFDDVVRSLSEKRFDDALRQAESLIASSPRDPRLWTAKALALAGKGRSEDSLGSFRKALDLRPDFLPALQGAAQTEYSTGNPHASVSLERILSLQPGNETAHAMLGTLDFERKDCANAVTHFQMSRAVIADNPQALWQFGQCLLTSGRADQAVEVFSHLLSRQPDNASVRYNLGLAQLQARNFSQAIATLQPLVGLPRPDADLLNLVAAAYEADHQTEAALAALRKAIEIAPKDVRSYLDLATLCMDHGAYALGTEIVDVGLRNIPDSAALYSMRGILHAQTMQFNEAEADFSHANRLEPDQVYGTVGLGITFMQKGTPEDSVRVLRERLVRNPEDATLNYLFAEALLRKAIEPGTPEFDEATSALLRSIKNKPDFAKAHAQLGKLHLLAGNTSKALEESELAVKLAPDDRMAVYSLVRALKASGRNEEARPLVSKLREIDARELKEEGDKNRVKLVRAAPPRPIER